MKFLKNQHENETVKINIQILNLKPGTIKNTIDIFQNFTNGAL